MSIDLSTGWEYAPAPESAAIGAVKDRYLPYVDGAFVEGRGEDLETFNPGTGEVLTTVSRSTAADVDVAVPAARAAAIVLSIIGSTVVSQSR